MGVELIIHTHLKGGCGALNKQHSDRDAETDTLTDRRERERERERERDNTDTHTDTHTHTSARLAGVKVTLLAAASISFFRFR